MIDNVLTSIDYGKNYSKKDDEPWHNPDTAGSH